MGDELRLIRQDAEMGFPLGAKQTLELLARLATAEADADRGWSWATDRGLRSKNLVDQFNRDLTAHDEALALRDPR